MAIKALINNLAILLALSFIFLFISERWTNRPLVRKISIALLFSLVSVVAMLTTFVLEPGVVFDGRSVVISIGSLFGGWLTAVFTVITASLFRLHMGGGGAWPGVGVITASALIGLAYRYLRKSNPRLEKPVFLYIFGVIVHVVMLLIMLTLPANAVTQFFNKISIWVIIFFPIATLLLGTLLSDLDKKLKALQSIKEDEEKLRGFFNSDVVGTLFCDIDGTIREANDLFLNIIGYNRDDLQAGFINWNNLTPKEYSSLDQEKIKEAEQRGSCIPYEKQYIHKNGQLVWVLVGFVIIGEKRQDILAFVLDITERKNAESQIQKNLKEKEVMLREIHHRVKNNMNIITSLLNLQAMQIPENVIAADIFRESINRIQSMAMIHERLYRSQDFSSIFMRDYIQKLVFDLQHLYDTFGNIKVVFDIKDISLDINSAIPMGLILNELVTNAFKHAFPDRVNGALEIIFTSVDKDHYSLFVRDDGIGLPEHIDISTTKSLGLQLIHILSLQLNGSLTITRENGTTFNVCFPKN